MTARAWGEAHRREAFARLFELSALCVRASRLTLRKMRPVSLDRAIERAASATAFRAAVADSLGSAIADREVARVRALAEGRLVRETVWRVYDDDEGCIYADDLATRAEAIRERDAMGPRECGRIVRVTRIRRAT